MVRQQRPPVYVSIANLPELKRLVKKNGACRLLGDTGLSISYPCFLLQCRSSTCLSLSFSFSLSKMCL